MEESQGESEAKMTQIISEMPLTQNQRAAILAGEQQHKERTKARESVLKVVNALGEAAASGMSSTEVIEAASLQDGLDEESIYDAVLELRDAGDIELNPRTGIVSPRDR